MCKKLMDANDNELLRVGGQRLEERRGEDAGVKSNQVEGQDIDDVRTHLRSVKSIASIAHPPDPDPDRRLCA